MMYRILSICVLMWTFLSPAGAQQIVNIGEGQSATVNCSGVQVLIDQPTAVQAVVRCLGAPPPPPPFTGVIVDHTSIGLFEQIPTEYLTAARAKRLLMRTASVGQNISQGLDCLVNNSANSCRTGFTVPASSIPVVSQPQYSRANWLFEFRGNPGWYGKLNDFITQVNTRTASFDVMSWKQSYVDDSTIYKFWENTTTQVDIFNLEAALVAHPTTVLYWTAAIAKLPMDYIEAFNQQMRVYTSMEGFPLLDLADIESHRPDGTLCSTNGIPTICSEYCVETSGGHLTNGMATQRAAKAVWVMMARLSGWNPQP